MKKLITLILPVMLIIGAANLTGCKYEEGPGLSFKSKEKRLIGNWKFLKVTDANGNEQNIASYEKARINILDGGTYENEFNDIVISSGTWAFSDDKLKIVVTYDNETEELTIIRLKTDDLWITDEDGIQYQMGPE
jgi:hypothetical protein